MSPSTFCSDWPVCAEITLAMRSRVRRISFAWMAMSVAGPPAPPPGWWIMKRVFGRHTRRSLGAARKTCVPALATHPVPTVVTGARTKRMMSWIASPDSTWPPGDEMSTVIGPSESSASAMRRVHVARATAWLISPNSMTKRDLKARRSAIASMRSGTSGFSSLMSIALLLAVFVRNGTTQREDPARSADSSLAQVQPQDLLASHLAGGGIAILGLHLLADPLEGLAHVGGVARRVAKRGIENPFPFQFHGVLSPRISGYDGGMMPSAA